jgi:beta-glucosidase
MDLQKLLDSMTIEEKCGQMTQIAIDLVVKQIKGSKGEIENQIDISKLINAVRENGVGSILNTPGSISIAPIAESSEFWQKIIQTIQDAALNETRLKIPILYGIDSIHGANYIKEGVLFPQPLSQAATFNRNISHKIGEITALETRAVGIPWNFSPVLDIGRQPLWSRYIYF